MNTTRFIEFCQKLLHDCATPVFLVIDDSPAHTANIVKDYVASTKVVFRSFLPPYSPELNPDKWVWKNVKHDRIK